jgi:hypothetical protein
MRNKTVILFFAILAAGLLAMAYTSSDPEKTITYVRLYPDADGISHFEDVEFKLAAEEVQPPAFPFYISAFEKATGYGYYSAPVGYFDDWHNAPRRQFIFCLEGEFQIEASDGTKRRFEQGSILLVEDTTGKGHRGRVLSQEDVLMLVVTLE